MSEYSQRMSIADIYSAIGGTAAVARVLGVGPSTASEMKRRGRIPAEYWRGLVQAASRQGHPEITADLLARLHDRNHSSSRDLGFSEVPLSEVPPLSEVQEHKPADQGQFSRFRHLRRGRFQTIEEVNDHVAALRDEWARR